MLVSWPALTSPPVFSVGDFVFVQARVVGCGESLRSVAAGEVSRSGHVLLFGDIDLEVMGMTTEQVTQSVADALEAKSGHRPATIQVVRVAQTNNELSVKMMLEIYSLRSRGCKPTRPLDDWQEPVNQDGPHYNLII